MSKSQERYLNQRHHLSLRFLVGIYIAFRGLLHLIKASMFKSNMPKVEFGSLIGLLSADSGGQSVVGLASHLAHSMNRGYPDEQV